MKLEVGKNYLTKNAGPVEIREDLGAGRKRFVGYLIKLDITITYFRNGTYSNAAKGGHPFNIVAEI